VAFEPRHAALLDKSTSGRVVSVDSSGGGEKLSYAVRIYEQNMLVAQEDVRVGVTVRRNVAVARASFARGDAIDSADITIQDEWLPLTKRPAAADVVAGSVAKGRINVGDVIDARNIEDPLAIRPGDQIVVDCISGALVVRTHAVAKEAGRQGEVIAAETVEWKQGILVKVSKAGHGVSMGPVDLKKRRSQSKSQRS
jgi:flagella basal body P-ring formation protein FlgA